MNIFFLDRTPKKSAQYLCDKHVPKMLLESAQMLSTAVLRHKTEFENYDKIYKSAYPNHPMTKWVGDTRTNFCWALENAVFISQEYCKRFKKIHKSSEVINNIYDARYIEDIPTQNSHLLHPDYITTPPQCMPDEYKDDDYVTAYRKYYQGAKAYFAKWQRGVDAPDWWAV